MLRDLKVYLWDLRKALAEIETFIADKIFDDYLAERMLQRAVERDFILIGEISLGFFITFLSPKALSTLHGRSPDSGTSSSMNTTA